MGLFWGKTHLGLFWGENGIRMISLARCPIPKRMHKRQRAHGGRWCPATAQVSHTLGTAQVSQSMEAEPGRGRQSGSAMQLSGSHGSTTSSWRQRHGWRQVILRRCVIACFGTATSKPRDGEMEWVAHQVRLLPPMLLIPHAGAFT